MRNTSWKNTRTKKEHFPRLETGSHFGAGRVQHNAWWLLPRKTDLWKSPILVRRCWRSMADGFSDHLQHGCRNQDTGSPLLLSCGIASHIFKPISLPASCAWRIFPDVWFPIQFVVGIFHKGALRYEFTLPRDRALSSQYSYFKSTFRMKWMEIPKTLLLTWFFKETLSSCTMYKNIGIRPININN